VTAYTIGIAEILVQESAVGPPPLLGGRVGVQGAPHGQPARDDAPMRSRSPLASVRPGSPASRVVVSGAGDQVAGADLGAIGDPDCGPFGDDTQGDEVIPDAKTQFPA
jgi:hypothetical protein